MKGILSVAEAASKISAILGRDIPVASIRSRALDITEPQTKTSVLREGDNDENSRAHPLARKEFVIFIPFSLGERPTVTTLLRQFGEL